MGVDDVETGAIFEDQLQFQHVVREFVKTMFI